MHAHAVKAHAQTVKDISMCIPFSLCMYMHAFMHGYFCVCVHVY